MHIGRSYRVGEFLDWTRRSIYVLVALGTVPVVLYHVFGQRWLGIPWTAVVLLGTATAFIVGFKNIQTYNRMWEARQVWADIVAASRGWGTMARDFANDAQRTREIVDRHLAWLTALRYEMRQPRPWETASDPYNAEYARHYTVAEHMAPLETELARYLSPAELARVMRARSKPSLIAALQGAAAKDLFSRQQIVVLQFIHLQREVKELFILQGRSERIKDFPYPRQYATVSKLFVRLFCILLPFGLLGEFDKLNQGVEGLMKGQMIWLVIPFSVLVSWVYTSLEQVGEVTENPFQGSSNDVPISQLAREAQIDILQMVGEANLPPALAPQDNVAL
jgi:putative membrane protein